MENTIQIVEQTSDGLVFDTKPLFNTVDKIGDKNIAIVSITGKQSTGKSLLLNHFVRFLKRNESNKNCDLNGLSDSVLKGFELRAGDHNATNGIWMWSEPIVVTANDGSELVLLLLETRCDFEDKNSSHESGIIFAISLLLSSTLIVNIKSDITEDVLKFVEYYTYLAQSFNGDSNSEMFQRLIIVVRDWEREWLYRFGYHHNNTTDINNYKQSMINPNANQCIEKRITRKRLLSYFDDISSYLMPHPGKSVTKPCFCGQIDLIDKDFTEKAEEFVQLVIKNLKPKLIVGQKLTSNSLKHYLNKWQEIIGNNIIAVKTNPVIKTDNELAFQSACNLYDTKIRACIESNQSDDMLLNSHNNAVTECCKYLSDELNVSEGDESVNRLLENLRNSLVKKFKSYRNETLDLTSKETQERSIPCIARSVLPIDAFSQKPNNIVVLELPSHFKIFSIH